jgi:hypothetical protein
MLVGGRGAKGLMPPIFANFSATRLRRAASSSSSSSSVLLCRQQRFYSRMCFNFSLNRCWLDRGLSSFFCQCRSVKKCLASPRFPNINLRLPSPMITTGPFSASLGLCILAFNVRRRLCDCNAPQIEGDLTVSGTPSICWPSASLGAAFCLGSR